MKYSKMQGSGSCRTAAQEIVDYEATDKKQADQRTDETFLPGSLCDLFHNCMYRITRIVDDRICNLYKFRYLFSEKTVGDRGGRMCDDDSGCLCGCFGYII